VTEEELFYMYKNVYLEIKCHESLNDSMTSLLILNVFPSVCTYNIYIHL